MACRRANATLLSEPVLEYCLLGPCEQASIKWSAKFTYFHSRKCFEIVVRKLAAILSRPQCVKNIQAIFPYVLESFPKHHDVALVLWNASQDKYHPHYYAYASIVRYDFFVRWQLSTPSVWYPLMQFTHCGLLTPYDDINLGLHLRQWRVSGRHLAITWTNIDL